MLKHSRCRRGPGRRRSQGRCHEGDRSRSTSPGDHCHRPRRGACRHTVDLPDTQTCCPRPHALPGTVIHGSEAPRQSGRRSAVRPGSSPASVRWRHADPDTAYEVRVAAVNAVGTGLITSRTFTTAAEDSGSTDKTSDSTSTDTVDGEGDSASGGPEALPASGATSLQVFGAAAVLILLGLLVVAVRRTMEACTCRPRRSRSSSVHSRSL